MSKKKLSDLRKDKKLTQRELAQELNISYGSIAMYESGKRIPSLKRAKLIAQYFDMAIEEISFSND